MLEVAERPYGRLRDAPVPDLRVATIQRYGLDSLPGQRAFSSMYVCYTPGIARICRTILSESVPDAGHTAEDVVQDTWFDASEQLVERFRPEAAVSPWLIQIARRRSIDTIRMHIVRSKLSGVDISDIETVDGATAIQSTYIGNRSSDDREAHELIEALDVLDRLPDTRSDLFRKLLVAKGLGETQQELANRYEVLLPTLKGRVQSAHKAVGKFIEQAEKGIPA